MNNRNDSIITKLRTTKPRSSFWFEMRIYSFGILIVGLLGLGMLSLAGFVIDTLDIIEIFRGGGIDNIWANLILELLLVSTLAGSAVYIIYRQTDWPIVRMPQFLLTLITLATLIGGGLIAWVGTWNNNLNLSDQFIGSIPFRSERQTKVQNFLAKKQLFVGQLTDLTQNKTTQYWILTLKNKQNTKTFVWESKVQPKINKNQTIVVQYENKSGNQVAVEAKYVTSIFNNSTNNSE